MATKKEEAAKVEKLKKIGELDPNEPYAIVCGAKGVAFKQGDKFFDNAGKVVKPEGLA